MTKLSPKSINLRSGYSAILIICLVGLFALILGGILPAARQIDRTGNEIAELQVALKQQEALLPLYASLQAQNRQSAPEALQLPKRAPLLLDSLEQLPALFEDVARTSGMQLVSATPQVRSLRDGRELLRVDTRMRGDYYKFRDLFLNLGKLPYLEHIETLSTDVVESGKELRLSIWLSIR